jgi:peptidyl-prolyl cis-trans isomerase SurA
MRRLFPLIVALAAMLSLAGSVAAQQVLGIAAVVDDEVISVYDLEERLDLVIVSANLPRTEESRRRLRPQILRTMVDEELQKIAARGAGVKVLNGDIDDEIASIAQRNNMSAERLISGLVRSGVDPEALRQQVLAGLAWQRFLAARLLRTVDVSDGEVDEAVQEREDSRGQTVFLVNEILLTVDNPADEVAVRNGAQRLVNQIREGARFDVLARQFSSGATAQQGGDVGWVRAEQLGPEIAEVLGVLPAGQVSDPVRTAAGYAIVGIRDTRIEGQQDKAGIEVVLSQLLIPLGRQASDEDADRAMAAGNSMRDLVSSCEDTGPLAAKLSTVSAADLGKLRIGDLPAVFQNAIGSLDVGGVSPPIRTAAGIHLLVVCERSQPADVVIDRSRIENEIIGRKLNQRALSYLRDLRRDTIVDFR